MKQITFKTCPVLVLFIWAALPIGSSAAEPQVSYSRDVRPILTRSCAGCHRPEKQKGRLDLSTYGALAHGGKKGPSFLAGDPDNSRLIEQVSGDDPPMPQKGEKLTASEVAVLTLWIRQGAKDDSENVAQSTIGAPHYPATYAVAPVLDAIACAPDGAILAIGGSNEVLLRSADGAELIARLPSASPRITSLCFSADGRILVAAGGSAGESGRVDVWDVAARKPLKTFVLSEDTAFGMSLSPTADRAAIGCSDRTARVISLEDGKEIARFDQHTDWALSTAFSVDGTKLLTASRDKGLRLFDLSTLKQIDQVNEPVEPLLCIARQPDHDLVAAGGASGSVRLYKATDLQKRTEEKRDPNRVRELDRQNGPANAMAFSRDGKWLAVASTGEARVYAADDGHRVATCSGNTGAVFTVCFNPDASRLYTGGFDGQLRIFDAQKGALIKAMVPVPTR